MSSVLVYIDSEGSKVNKSTLGVISAALKVKSLHGYDSVVGVLLGESEVKEAAESVSSFGLDKIVYVESSDFKNYLAPVYSKAIKEICSSENPSLILSAASSTGKDFMPRVATYLDAPQVSDITDFKENGIFVRPMYAGNIIAEVEIESSPACATVRLSAFDAPEPISDSTNIEKLDISVGDKGTTELVSFDMVKSERPELGDADVVISGGRALGSTENFEKVLYPLADFFAAALGASRAAVDAGYVPNDWQVGQTGKIVAPKLYFAIGISGAVQHLAGMKDSKVIVAINKDEEAPIFEIADYGLVADLFDAVPELVEKLKAQA